MQLIPIVSQHWQEGELLLLSLYLKLTNIQKAKKKKKKNHKKNHKKSQSNIVEPRQILSVPISSHVICFWFLPISRHFRKTQ